VTSAPVSLDRAGRKSLLVRVLEEPDLVTAVRALAPRELSAVIRHVGLEDAGELVALATPEQLTRLLDEDAWTSERPGEDETFDGARFALWLEVLLESGDEGAAEKLVDLPEELVFLGLSRQVLVIDMDALVVDIAQLDRDDADAIDKALESALSEEIGGFRIISRRHDGWDAVLSVLLALDRNHHAFLTRLLERLCDASSELIEDGGGLASALSSAEMLASDAAADREDRRAAEGFVAPSAARSFLALARAASAEQILAEKQRDPVTRAYFRELDRAPALLPPEAKPSRSLSALLREASLAVRGSAPDTPESFSARSASLADAPAADAIAALTAGARARRGPKGAASSRGPQETRGLRETREPQKPREPLFRAAMRELGERDTVAYARRLEELGYLVNVLMVGAEKEGRALRPFEAVEAAVAACDTGLSRVLAATKQKRSSAGSVLATLAADQLFRVGWR
jgi:hypothetical protein